MHILSRCLAYGCPLHDEYVSSCPNFHAIGDGGAEERATYDLWSNLFTEGSESFRGDQFVTIVLNLHSPYFDNASCIRIIGQWLAVSGENGEVEVCPRRGQTG
jgi:hypothetical protein